ncbi:MAG: dTDP-glucose 4,6-dehydratase [Candidatus Micrarchaeota archaeon]
MENRILVTGGCGFIGSNFIRFLLDKHPDLEIVNLDKLTYAGNKDNTKDLESKSNYSYVKGDICDPKAVEKAMKDCGAVVNFAAETHVDRSIESGENFVKTNMHGTYVLLEKARNLNTERFLQISTDEVYGSIERGSFKESDWLQPNSPYSASKAGADLLCRSYNVTYGVPTLITRSSNNFGPYQHPEKLIPKFITNAFRDIQLPLYGDGLNVRDWIHVWDNCEAIETVLMKGTAGQVYNIGGGNEKTNKEITELILKKLDKPTSLIQKVPDRLGHDRRYSVDSTKLHKLGWKPKYGFKEAMDETVSWYLDNPKWWEKLI